MSEIGLPPQTDGPQWPRSAVQSPAGAFDYFNDDLVQILDELVTKTGGTFGVLSGHTLIEGESSLLALTTVRPAVPDAFFAKLAAYALGATDVNRRRRGDDGLMMLKGTLAQEPGPNVSSPPTDHPGSENYRTLQLTFWPAQNISLVATVCRPEAAGAFEVFAEVAASTLCPALSRYVRLWWMHRLERRRANTMGAALDGIDMGILLLDRRGDVVFENARAGRLLQERDGICRDGRAVLALRAADGVQLKAVIQHAIHCNQRKWLERASDRATILQLARRDQRRPLIVSVTHAERAAADSQDPAVIVYVLDPDQNVEPLLAPVCGLYKLSASETRLVMHLVSGLRVAEAADKMKVQAQTARAYLKQIFLKTMTNRQTDLVRIMLSSVMRTHEGSASVPR